MTTATNQPRTPSAFDLLLDKSRQEADLHAARQRIADLEAALAALVRVDYGDGWAQGQTVGGEYICCYCGELAPIGDDGHSHCDHDPDCPVAVADARLAERTP